MINLLLTEFIPGYTQSINQYIKSEFDLEPTDLNIIMVGSLPRDDGKYLIDHLVGTVVTDYWQFKSTDNVRRIDDMATVSDVGDIVASHFITPKVWYTDEVEVAQRWLAKLPSTFAYDTETRGLAIKDIGDITMHSFSIPKGNSIVLIDSPVIRALIFDFLITTEQSVVCHNLAFDMRPIYRATSKFIKNYEDTQLIAQAYMNNAKQPLFSLKALAGGLLGDWASAKTSFELYEDSTDYDNPNLVYVGSNPDVTKYNLPLIYYAGVDTTATIHLWNKFSRIDPEFESVDIGDLLPIPEPRYHEESPRFFYENVLKPLIRTNIELLETPMPIDMGIVEEIKQEALDQKEPAFDKLQNFPAVMEYMATVKAQLITKLTEPLLEQKRNWPVRVYKHTPADRTFVMNKLTGESRDSWKIVDIKQYLKEEEAPDPLVQAILDKSDSLPTNSRMQILMKSHRTLNQTKLQHKLDNPEQYLDPKQTVINPNASQQMRGLWKSLGLESDVLTPKKEESFSKEVLESIVKTTSNQTAKEVIQQVLEIAATKNLLSQYIPAYEHSSKDGFCYQSMKCPGTKSYRISGAVGKVDKSVISDEPLSGFGASMVTQPGITKRAVVAPDGFIIATSDYAGLEGVIGACITHDPNKVAIFNDGLDLHCLNAASFFQPEVEELLGRPVEQTLEFNKFFNAFRKEHKSADKLRSAAKSPNYLLEYGGYPPKLSKDLGCSLAVAQSIFDKFHYETFLGTTNYREDYVLPTVVKQGYLHLGLGARIYSSNPQKDIRTVTNAGYQFWSILTLIGLYLIKERIKSAGYEHDIFIYSTIHDSITAYVRQDPAIIKWYNDNLIECMVPDFLIDQEVTLESNVDIGPSYDKCVELPNECSIEHINQVLATF